MVRRRERREPLQHLLGTVCFCGFELIVNRDVLIPRPETEVLAEMAWTHLLERQGCEPPTVLDFGTGSGCVAIAIAHHVPSARVHALDASPSAVGVARQNAALQGLSERIQFNMGDAFAAVPGGLRFDLIVTNPPYIPSGEIDGLEPEVRDHDPRMALDGGRDGLAFYRLLAAEAPAHLNAGGTPDGRVWRWASGTTPGFVRFATLAGSGGGERLHGASPASACRLRRVKRRLACFV